MGGECVFVCSLCFAVAILGIGWCLSASLLSTRAIRCAAAVSSRCQLLLSHLLLRASGPGEPNGNV